VTWNPAYLRGELNNPSKALVVRDSDFTLGKWVKTCNDQVEIGQH